MHLIVLFSKQFYFTFDFLVFLYQGPPGPTGPTGPTGLTS
jgi:hypothetical protein